MRTVVLVVRFAEFALETGTDLSANTNTVSNLNGCNLVAHFDGLANNFMADADGERAVAPAASDCVDIRAADTAALNLYVDITVFELLRFELGIWSATRRTEVSNSMAAHLLLLKVAPFALILDHVTLKRLWVRHVE